MLPVVTLHHFTTPRWAAADGGWANPAIVDRFTRFTEVVAERLGDGIGTDDDAHRVRYVDDSLVGVDRATQARTLKPSAHWLAEVIRTNTLP